MINLNQDTCKIFQVCISVGPLNVFSSHLMYNTHTDFNILHYFYADEKQLQDKQFTM